VPKASSNAELQSL